MQNIEGSTISINRGDELNINLSIKKQDGTNYIYQVGDVVVFCVYKKGKMNEEAVLLKRIEVPSETESISINCTNEETKIGEMKNKPIEYWYEIELNDKYTVIGYDKLGPKLFMLYPEGSQEI